MTGIVPTTSRVRHRKTIYLCKLWHLLQHLPQREVRLVRFERRQPRPPAYTHNVQARGDYAPGGCLSFGPIETVYYVFCDISVRERTGAASQAFQRMHNTLRHRVKSSENVGTRRYQFFFKQSVCVDALRLQRKHIHTYILYMHSMLCIVQS